MRYLPGYMPQAPQHQTVDHAVLRDEPVDLSAYAAIGTSMPAPFRNHSSNRVSQANTVQAELLEMDQRQRIFEDVIIQRIKVIQDFVTSRYNKVNR